MIVMPPKKRGRKKKNDDGAGSSENTRNNDGAGPSRPPPVIIDLDQETWVLRGEHISIFHPELEYGTPFLPLKVFYYILVKLRNL